ncbi:Homocysteine S-methyltransferase [Biscogniauxia sp. FL1348]|nr:Homocysteine S-methyltransferase [Biscogniauxia sp. FL1348]
MASSTPLFLDGGLGTSLEDKYGVKFSYDTPLWSSHLLVSDQDTLRSCQRDFGRVPVDIILTATYQVSIEGFARTRTPDHPDGIQQSHIPQYLDRAVSIAEQVKAPSASVALSLGPYGACMIPSQEYSGQYDAGHSSAEELLGWHLDRIRLFDQVGNLPNRIDFLAFETVPRLDEIKAIRSLFARSTTSSLAESSVLRKNVPYWISCVFPGTDYTLPDGSTVDQVIEALLAPESPGQLPWGIGINCTQVAKLPELIRRYHSSVSRLVDAGRLETWPNLLLYPDGTNGEVYDTTTKTWRQPENGAAPTAPWERQLADIVANALDMQCWRSVVVGGCCKATHADISKLRSAILHIG